MFKDIYYHTASIPNHNLIDYLGMHLNISICILQVQHTYFVELCSYRFARGENIQLECVCWFSFFFEKKKIWCIVELCLY